MIKKLNNKSEEITARAMSKASKYMNVKK